MTGHAEITAEITAKNRDLNHKPKLKTTIWRNHVHTQIPLPRKGKQSVDGVQGHFLFSITVHSKNADQPYFKRGEKKGVLLTPEVEIDGPGDYRTAHDCHLFFSEHSNLIVCSGDILGRCQVFECLSRPKVYSWLVHKLLKHKDFLCVHCWIPSF